MSEIGFGASDSAPLPTEEEALAHAAAEELRKASATMVNSVYRLVKACQLHNDVNQAVLQLVPVASGAVGDVCKLTSAEVVTVLYAGDTVFVNGQILRASRETYALARELGAFLKTCDVTELAIDRTVTTNEMAAFARLLADAQRDRRAAAQLIDMGLKTIRVRKVMGNAGDGPMEKDDSPIARIGRVYAASIIVLRGMFESVKRGDYKLPQRVKRVAQKLVQLAEDDPRMLVALATAPSGASDAATLGVNTAIVALTITRQLTNDRLTLSSVAMAALLYDVGRPRLSASVYGGETSVERRLNEEEQDRLPASAVVALTALGRLHAPSIARTVVAYEAIYLQRGARLGQPYRGLRSPTGLARILSVSRFFNELRTPAKGAAPLRLDDVIQLMTNKCEDATELTYVKLLIGALGFFPTGTLVELNTGEMGVVMAAPELPVNFARPPVRILYDRGGQLLEKPFDLDLAERGVAGQPKRFICRPIDADAQQMKAMRAFAMAAAPKRRPDPAPEPAAAPPPQRAAARPRAAPPVQPRRAMTPPPIEPLPPFAEATPAGLELQLDSRSMALGDPTPSGSPFDPPQHSREAHTLSASVEDLAEAPLQRGSRGDPPPLRRHTPVPAARRQAPRAPAVEVPPELAEFADLDEPLQPSRVKPPPRASIQRGEPAAPDLAPRRKSVGARIPRVDRRESVPPARAERPAARPAQRAPVATVPKRHLPPADVLRDKPRSPPAQPAASLSETDELLAAYLAESRAGAGAEAPRDIYAPPVRTPSRQAVGTRSRDRAPAPAAAAPRERARPAKPAASPGDRPTPVAGELAPPARAFRPPPSDSGASGAPPSLAPTRAMDWTATQPPPSSSQGQGFRRDDTPPPSRNPTRALDWSQQARVQREAAPDSEPAPPSNNPTRAIDWSQQGGVPAGPPSMPPPIEAAPSPSERAPASNNPTRAMKWASTEAFLSGIDPAAPPDGDKPPPAKKR